MSSEYAPGGNQYGGGYGGGYGDASARPKNGMAVTGLVIGILALLSSWFVLGLPLAIVGLILSIVGLRRVRAGRANNRGVALGGVILNVVALVLSVVLTAVYAFAIWGLWTNGGEEAWDCVKSSTNETQVQACFDQYAVEQPNT